MLEDVTPLVGDLTGVDLRHFGLSHYHPSEPDPGGTQLEHRSLPIISQGSFDADATILLGDAVRGSSLNGVPFPVFVSYIITRGHHAGP